MMAKTLENNGATVYIVGRRLEVLEKAAKDHSVRSLPSCRFARTVDLSSSMQKHGKILPLKGDVTSRESLLSIVERIKQEQGHINILVNNSGVLYNNIKPPEVGDDIKAFQAKLWNAGTPEEFNKTFEVNVAAVYYTTVAFLELLDAGNNKGSSGAPTSQVITVSSIGGFRRDDKVFSLSYSASKAAVTQMAKTLSNVLKAWQIRSNIIAPGLYPSGT